MQHIRLETKQLAEQLMNSAKQIVQGTGKLMPIGYFMVYDHEQMIKSNPLTRAVVPLGIPNVQTCFQSREAKLELTSFIKNAALKLNSSLTNSSKKIIAVLVINDAYYYSVSRDEKIDVKNVLLPQYHQNRKEAIVGMLYFENSIFSFNYPYVRGISRIIFENPIIEEPHNLQGIHRDLFPHNV